jgi:hypothetical protein
MHQILGANVPRVARDPGRVSEVGLIPTVSTKISGKMRERSNRPDWKSVRSAQGHQGSNPCLTAKINQIMESRKAGVLIGLENRDGANNPVGVRSPHSPPN